MTDIPEDIQQAAKKVSDRLFRVGDFITSHVCRDPTDLIARAILAERERMEALANRRTTDMKYMLQAYRNMLGPKGLEVVAIWDANGVQRVHYDWVSGANELDGEGRASVILDIEESISREVPSVDGDWGVVRFDDTIRTPSTPKANDS